MPLVLAGGEWASDLRGLRAQARERARKVIPQYSRGSLVRVAGGRNQAEAELIQNLLLEEGVPSLVRRSAAFDVPDFLAAGPRDVLVPESGAETARALLAEAELVGEEAGLVAAPPDSRRVLTLLAVIAAAALVSALIAWALLEAAV
jgi:hypothetical protein